MSDYTVPNDQPTGDRSAADESTSHGPLRASDSERDEALHLLAAHYADGRLQRAEFDERAEAALAARTRDQLRALFGDLPGPRPVPVPLPVAASAPDAQQPVPYPGQGGLPAPSMAPLMRILFPLILIAAVLATLNGHPPFPLIPILFILGRRSRRWNREARPWT